MDCGPTVWWRGWSVLVLAALAAVATLGRPAPAPARTFPSAEAPLAALAGVVERPAATRSGAADGCGAGGLVCSVVDVPLDRSGGVPGTVPLHVEMLPSDGPARGTVFLVAGGPGQGSAATFDLGDPTQAAFFRFLFPGYTLVAYDDRGTGSSAPLDCPSLRAAAPDADPAQVAAECAAELGPEASFYSTADHAADLDAVRAALGLDRIAIFGVSYGTRLALAYAAAHPVHVERLVLDSIEPPGHDQAFATDVLEAMPATLARFCAGGLCARATSDYAGDVAAVANRLASAPGFGSSVVPGVSDRLTALTLLDLVVATDLNPGVAAELPAAVHAARSGNFAPLQHVLRIAGAGSAAESRGFSDALYLATVCEDGPFPWAPGATFPARTASIQSALAALPSGSLGPFAPWAAEVGDAWVCAGWPSGAADTPAPSGPLPDVPVLAFSGGLDLRTPTAGAAAVVAAFPQGHLVVVPAVGHSVLSSDTSLCSQLALRDWLRTDQAPAVSCPRAKPLVAPLAAFPGPSRTRLDPGETRAAAAKTVQEAEAAWLASAGASGDRASLRGIYGGKLVATGTSFTLAGYSIAPGVTLSGRISVQQSFRRPLVFVGSVRVAGAEAATGTLTLDRGALRGTLRARRA